METLLRKIESIKIGIDFLSKTDGKPKCVVLFLQEDIAECERIIKSLISERIIKSLIKEVV